MKNIFKIMYRVDKAKQAIIHVTQTIRVVLSGLEWGYWGIRKRHGCAEFYFFESGHLNRGIKKKIKILLQYILVQFISIAQSCPTLCNPWTAARQVSPSITNSQSSPKPMSTESVMPSNYLILCHPHLLLFSIFPSIRVFSNESALRIRWPK